MRGPDSPCFADPPPRGRGGNDCFKTDQRAEPAHPAPEDHRSARMINTRLSVDPSGETLVYTKKSDLVPNLCAQSLTTGDVTDLLPLSADSQEAAISPDGRLAFTYYKFNARGDICYRPLAGKRMSKRLSVSKPKTGSDRRPFGKARTRLDMSSEYEDPGIADRCAEYRYRDDARSSPKAKSGLRP